MSVYRHGALSTANFSSDKRTLVDNPSTFAFTYWEVKNCILICSRSHIKLDRYFIRLSSFYTHTYTRRLCVLISKLLFKLMNSVTVIPMLIFILVASNYKGVSPLSFNTTQLCFSASRRAAKKYLSDSLTQTLSSFNTPRYENVGCGVVVFAGLQSLPDFMR